MTKDGCEVITRFPAEELLVVGKKYYTATGPLTETRETQSHKNIDYTGVDYGGAGWPEGYVPVAQRVDGKNGSETA